MIAGGILMGFGTLSILYFILYAVLVDLNNIFTYFWLLAGGFLLAVGFYVFRLYKRGGVLPKKIWLPACLAGGLVSLFFAIMIGVIAFEAWQKPTEGADYMVILGARVRGERITSLLRYRLDAALDYLSDNPDTTVIVSGGQGPGENISEAEAMRRYLLEHGVAAERILMDDKSLNTEQNIENSIALIQDRQNAEKPHIVIVSNGFHLFRATRIIKKQLSREETDGQSGKAIVEGLGAPTKWYVIPNSYVREVFAVIKYKLSGQI